jgi:hypothetical protein
MRFSDHVPLDSVASLHIMLLSIYIYVWIMRLQRSPSIKFDTILCRAYSTLRVQCTVAYLGGAYGPRVAALAFPASIFRSYCLGSLNAVLNAGGCWLTGGACFSAFTGEDGAASIFLFRASKAAMWLLNWDWHVNVHLAEPLCLKSKLISRASWFSSFIVILGRMKRSTVVAMN